MDFTKIVEDDVRQTHTLAPDIDAITKFINLGEYQSMSDGCDYDDNVGMMLVFDKGECLICEDFLRAKHTNDDDYITVNIEAYAPRLSSSKIWIKKAAEAIRTLPCYYNGEQYALVEDDHVNAGYWQKQTKVEHIF